MSAAGWKRIAEGTTGQSAAASLVFGRVRQLERARDVHFVDSHPGSRQLANGLRHVLELHRLMAHVEAEPQVPIDGCKPARRGGQAPQPLAQPGADRQRGP